MAFLFEPRITPQDPEWAEKILEAKRTPADERMLAGPKLFDLRCQEARQLIRQQSPDFNDEQVEEELQRWLAKEREVDEVGIYRNLGTFNIDLSDEELFRRIENNLPLDAE